jgi:putative hydrolase of the HAD superfamily
MRRTAIVFDLDDTLYRERRYALSGFAAVAAWAGATFGLPTAPLFRELVAALKRGDRARAFQGACARFGLNQAEVPRFVDVMRQHQPRLRLSRRVRSTLLTLAAGRPTAILTNGRRSVQARKVAALGVAALVDSVLFAADHGTGAGKPDPGAFLAACARLGIEPSAGIFVGNDPVVDIAGARAVGMLTVRVGTDAPSPGAPDADLVLDSVTDLPPALGRLGVRHAA